MADGSTKPISDVEPGDKILASDPATGQESAETVAAVWVHTDTLVELQLATDSDGDGEHDTITTTDDHPFWNATDRQWQPAAALDPGDQLLTPSGDTIPIHRLNPRTTSKGAAYNLTVTGPHTYHVHAATTPILAHNTCRKSPKLWKLTKEGASDIKQGGPFNTKFYKSRSDGTWWTRDIAGHGDSAFKVYEEIDGGLNWIMDADKFGDEIGGKWKGSKGRFIPWSKLRGVKR